ncbi:MAG: hypothetical protein GIKADHBN_03239 [Phycisphaerales bacterium]|nr:hypothetical protein [Phycisphaerales bacterium]
MLPKVFPALVTEMLDPDVLSVWNEALPPTVSRPLSAMGLRDLKSIAPVVVTAPTWSVPPLSVSWESAVPPTACWRSMVPPVPPRIESDCEPAAWAFSAPVTVTLAPAVAPTVVSIVGEAAVTVTGPWSATGWPAVEIFPPSRMLDPLKVTDASPVPVTAAEVVITPPRTVAGSAKVELPTAIACVPPLRPMMMPLVPEMLARSESETSSVPAPPPMPIDVVFVVGWSVSTNAPVMVLTRSISSAVKAVFAVSVPVPPSRNSVPVDAVSDPPELKLLTPCSRRPGAATAPSTAMLPPDGVLTVVATGKVMSSMTMVCVPVARPMPRDPTPLTLAISASERSSVPVPPEFTPTSMETPFAEGSRSRTLAPEPVIAPLIVISSPVSVSWLVPMSMTPEVSVPVPPLRATLAPVMVLVPPSRNRLAVAEALAPVANTLAPCRRRSGAVMAPSTVIAPPEGVRTVVALPNATVPTLMACWPLARPIPRNNSPEMTSSTSACESTRSDALPAPPMTIGRVALAGWRITPPVVWISPVAEPRSMASAVIVIRPLPALIVPPSGLVMLPASPVPAVSVSASLLVVSAAVPVRAIWPPAPPCAMVTGELNAAEPTVVTPVPVADPMVI